MRVRLTSSLLALALVAAVLAGVVATATPADAASFSNTSSIGLRDPNFGGNPNCSNPAVLCNATATTYPSNISVTGLSGTVSSVSLSLNNVSYAFSDDIDALLVSPGGQSLIVVAAVGANTGTMEAASNSTLTISDSGTLPTDVTPWGSAPTFKPVNFGSYGLGNSVNGFNEDYTSPAPAAPWGDPGQHGTNATLGNTFDGTNPDGTWSLYVITTSAGDGTGAIAGGWTLNITTAASAAPTTTTLTSAPNPSFTGGTSSSVTLTATVTSTSAVNEGTVDFTDGGVTISGCGAIAVSAGVATCTTTFTTEGNHSLEALYSGTTNFGASNATLTQQVNDHTTVTGSSYCNTGSIALGNAVGDAAPYPSRVFVSGLSGTLSHLTVSLNGVTYSESQDIDALLVGPGGQSLILVADAGPNSAGAISNVTLTLDDSATTTLAQSAIWGAPNSTVTSKPVNYGGLDETFGPPAPAGPYGNPGPAGGGTATLATQFNGSNPNGTWSLYVVDTAAGDGTGAISGGWCANITAGTATPTTTAIASNNNPSFTAAPGNSVTFTATVTSTSTVSEGTVDFTSNGVTIAGCGTEAVSAGTATCTTTFSSEGSDTIEALYSGTTNFGASNASLTQAVNDHTTVTGNSFCNTGSIALNNPTATNPEIGATPYPSNIFVTGRPGNLQHLSVTLNGVSYSESQDIDALLVGPGGQSLILAAAAGPNSGGAISNVTLTLDDNASSTLSASAIWGSPGSTVTSKPVNYGGDNETWGPPAPAGPYGNPGPFGGGTATLGSTFNGASPNGTWSLYLITTAAGDGTGSVSGGWCLGITSPAPPTLTKSFGASSIPLNGSTSLSFTVTNPNTASSLTNVGFTDTLPSGLTLSTPAGETGTCGGGTIAATGGGTTISLSGATLASGANCTFSVNVTGITAGSQVNTTGAPTSTEGGTGTAATATLLVVAPPVLTKSFGALSIGLGGSTTLSFSVSNPNASASLSGIGFADTLPSGLGVSTPNGETGTCGGGTITASAGSGSVSLSGATLAAGATCTFSVNVTGTSVGSKVNTTSTVSSIEGGTGTAASATLMVTSGPVSITKSFGATTIPLNGSSSITITVSNPAGNGTATGVAFTDHLPAGLHLDTAHANPPGCGGSATISASMISYSNGTLADGATCTAFSGQIIGVAAGVQTNSVTVSSTQGGTGNTATASITVVAPPTLTKSFGASMVPLNGSTSLSFTVTNPNTTTTLTGIGFTDTFPSGLMVSSPNGLTGSCGGGTITATAVSGSVALSGATLAPSATCTFSVNVTGTAAGNQVNTTSTISSNEGGAGAAATATLMVASGPPQITKSFGAASIPLNGSTSLSFTIINPAANGTSTGIAFTDNLPAGLDVATPSGLTGSCGGATITATAGSSAVSLTGATLAAGASCTFSVNVTGIAPGLQTNSVTVSSTNGGTGNTSVTSLTVVAPPVLTKAFNPTSIPLNGTSTLSFTVVNTNTGTTLTGVGFTDTLPTGMTVATPNGLSGSCGGGTITAAAGGSSVSLSGATLAASATCTFSVSITATTPGTLHNTTGAVTSNEGGTGATATATLTVVAPPVIAKAFSPTSVAINRTSMLTLTLTNPAANTAPEMGVGFDDTFPTGMIVATPSGGASDCADANIMANPGSGSVTASGILIPVGGTCTITLNVMGTVSGALTNSVTISSTNGGTGNTAMATLNVALPPQITKAFGAMTIPLNGSTTLSFTVTNPNAAQPATGVAFTDNLPSGLVVSTPNGLSGSCGGGTITATAGSGSVALSGATLAASAICTFSVKVTGTTAGVQNNSVQVTSTSGGAGNTATASVTVVAPPRISKAFGATSVPLGGSTSLTFTVTNPNATVSLTGVGFTDTLPSGMVVATPLNLSSTCGGTKLANAGGTSISLSGATLAASATCTLSVTVTGTSAGSLLNTSGVVASSNGGTGGTASATLTVVAPPVIAKSFGATNIALGGTTSLTFTITNPAANTAALTGVAFTDALPAGLVVTTPNGLSGTCGGGTITATAGSGSVSLSGASIATGGTCMFSVSVTGMGSGTKVNSVTVTSSNGGAGNTATATLSVALPPTIAKTFGAATIRVGGSTTLTFTVANPNATFALTGVAFTDSLPAGLVVSTPNGKSGSCGGGTITAVAGSTSVSLSGATLAGGARCTISVNVTGTTAGVLVNSVTVTSANAGPGNMAMAAITVVAPPTIAKAFGAASVPFGGSTSLTFTLNNPNTTVSVTGVGFTDTLPSGLMVATPNGESGTCGSGIITATAGSGSISLSGATIPASGSCTFSVNVTAKAVGQQVNTTSAVTSANGGTGLTATATLMVTKAPTTTTVAASPTSPLFGHPVTFTATVVPSGPNGSGINPTGTVSFFLNGSATPIAVVPLGAAGTASFTTSALGAGSNTVTASYSGDTNFLPSSSSTSATATVTCTTTITGTHVGTVTAAGATCIINATITGAIVVPQGSSLDLEGSTVSGSVNESNGTAGLRMCGSSSSSVTVTGSTAFVVIGDAMDGCATNTISGSLTLINNTGGVQAINNFVGGAVTASGNSGAGPFPDDPAPNISGNGH